MDGFFLVCAIDHLRDFAELVPGEYGPASFAEVVVAKDAVVRAFAASVSAFLLDPVYALGHLLLSGALPRGVGLISGVEDEDYLSAAGARETTFRLGWGPRKIRLAGADACKVLWFYRPDGDPAVAARQRDVVRYLVDDCRELSLPLILEPIWFPLPGEDPSSASWRSRRAQGIVSSAIEANQLGIDLLKVEFPGYVNSERDQSRAAAACQELDAGIDVPWVLLSAGVSYVAFATQMRIAGEAGASGFMAGRSIWRDAVATKELAARPAALAQARDRLEELAAITRRHGHPHLPVRPLPEVLQALPDGWYRNWAQTS